jgi:hypothetical protein
VHTAAWQAWQKMHKVIYMIHHQLHIFSIATRIAEENKEKIPLLWERFGGGVRFLRDGRRRRNIVNDVVQGFHVDTRLLAAALVRLLFLLLHHACL